MRIAAPATFVVALVVALTTFAPRAHAQAPYFATHDLQAAVNGLQVTDLEGRRWSVAEMRGRVVLIDFWATWCAPCLAELPRLKRLRDAFGAQFEVLGISVDSRSRRDMVTWLNRMNVQWPQVHDGRAFSSPAARRFGVAALPASLLMADGRIVGMNLRGDALERAVRHLTSTSSFDAARVPIVIR